MANNKPPEINLKIDKKDRDDGKIQLIITVPVQAVGEVLKSAAYALAQQNRLNLEGVGVEDIISFVVETVGDVQYLAFANQYAMNAAAPHAIMQKNIEPIMEPEFSAMGEIVPGKEFTFIAVVTPKPHFELSSYDPVTIKMPKITVSDAEIDEQILYLAQQNVEIVADEGAEVADGTEMVFAIKSNFKDDSEPIPSLTAERRYHQTGQGFLSQGFDDALIGMKPGDSRSFEFELPVSYAEDNSPAETRTVATTIDLLQIDKRVVPAITDAWVKANMPDARDVDGLREMMRSQGMEFKTIEQKKMELYAAASALAERFKGTIPDDIYEFARGDILANLVEQLRQNGATLEQYMQEMGLEQQQFNMMLMMQVRETLRQGFALDALARHLKLTITEEDLVDTISRMAPGNEERMRAEFEASGRMYMLREAAMRTKANKMLLEAATIEVIE